MIRVSGRKLDQISAESITREIITELAQKSSSDDRLNVFVEEYNKEFKKPEFVLDFYFGEVLLPFILRIMKGPLTLYALALNGQVLIDLAAILEQYAIIYISELFSTIPARN